MCISIVHLKPTTMKKKLYVVYDYEKWTVDMSDNLFQHLKKSQPGMEITLESVDDRELKRVPIKEVETWTHFRNTGN